MKQARKEAEGTKKKTTKKTSKKAEMPTGSLDRFTKVMKAGINKPKARSKSPIEEIDMAGGEAERAVSVPAMTGQNQQQQHVERPKRPAFRLPAALPPPSSSAPDAVEVLDLSLSPNPQAIKKQRVLRRSQSETIPPVSHHLIQLSDSIDAETITQTPIRNANLCMPSIRELSPFVATRRPRSPIRRTKSIPRPPTPLAARPSTPPPPPPTYLPSAAQMSKKTPTPKRKCQAVVTEVITLSSSPATTPSSRQQSITAWLSPRNKAAVGEECPDSPSPRRDRGLLHSAGDNDMQINLARFSSPSIPTPRLFLAKEARRPMGEGDANVVFPGVDLESNDVGIRKDREMDVVVLSDHDFADTYGSDSGDELPPFPIPLPLQLPTVFALPAIRPSRHDPSINTASNHATTSLPSPSTASRPGADISQTSTSRNVRPPPPVPQQAPHPTPPYLPAPAPPPIAVPASEPQAQAAPLPRFRRIIRIRDSLAGAWAEEDVIDLVSSPSLAGGGAEVMSSAGQGSGKVNASETVNASRRGNGKEEGSGKARPRTKEWRTSQVEVLDLS